MPYSRVLPADEGTEGTSAGIRIGNPRFLDDQLVVELAKSAATTGRIIRLRLGRHMTADMRHQPWAGGHRISGRRRGDAIVAPLALAVPFSLVFPVAAPSMGMSSLDAIPWCLSAIAAAIILTAILSVLMREKAVAAHDLMLMSMTSVPLSLFVTFEALTLDATSRGLDTVPVLKAPCEAGIAATTAALLAGMCLEGWVRTHRMPALCSPATGLMYSGMPKARTAIPQAGVVACGDITDTQYRDPSGMDLKVLGPDQGALPIVDSPESDASRKTDERPNVRLSSVMGEFVTGRLSSSAANVVAGAQKVNRAIRARASEWRQAVSDTCRRFAEQSAVATERTRDRLATTIASAREWWGQTAPAIARWGAGVPPKVIAAAGMARDKIQSLISHARSYAVDHLDMLPSGSDAKADATDDRGGHDDCETASSHLDKEAPGASKHGVPAWMENLISKAKHPSSDHGEVAEADETGIIPDDRSIPPFLRHKTPGKRD